MVHGPDVTRPEARYEDMSPEVYDRVKRQLLPWVQTVTLTGGGEPFLAPVFYQMLDDVLGAGKSVEVVTNGTIIRPDYLERLVGTPSTLEVSLDGATAEVNDRIRLGVKFDRVMEFLETVREIMRRSAHPGFTVGIRWAVTRSNVQQMLDCVELAHRYGVRQIAFENFDTFGRSDEFARQESLEAQPSEVLPHWKQAYDRGLQVGVAVLPMRLVDAWIRQPEEGSRRAGALLDGQRIRHCPLPWWSVYVEVDGTIKACCRLPAPMGDLRQSSFREIWNGPTYRLLRSLVNTPSMPEECRTCSIVQRF